MDKIRDTNDFLKRLGEDKYSENPEELIKLRLPIVQFYFNHYVKVDVRIHDNVFSSELINIDYNPETDFTLVNYAYERIRENLKRFIE